MGVPCLVFLVTFIVTQSNRAAGSCPGGRDTRLSRGPCIPLPVVGPSWPASWTQARPPGPLLPSTHTAQWCLAACWSCPGPPLWLHPVFTKPVPFSTLLLPPVLGPSLSSRGPRDLVRMPSLRRGRQPPSEATQSSVWGQAKPGSTGEGHGGPPCRSFVELVLAAKC